MSLATAKEPQHQKGIPPEVYLRAQPFLQDLERFLQKETNSFEPELLSLVDYVFARPGKRLRSLLTYLAGTNAEGAYTSDQIKIAAVIEMVHLATLVHDDILDEAAMRHNRETVSALYGTPSAVLLGDALFAQALNLASSFSSTEVCRAVATATRQVCAGEIDQSLFNQEKAPTRERYFRIIELKTAELFDVSCRLGASFGCPQPSGFPQAAGLFGRQLGIAYQIYDDLLDIFGNEVESGKTLGTDIMSGKVTLPIFALRDLLSEKERHHLDSRLAGGSPEIVEEMLQLLRQPAVYQAVHATFNRIISEGIQTLEPFAHLPASAELHQLGTLLREKIADLGPL
ncbi:MAG: polyprenyl synthetase family protein [Puniceicoccaceae bacterium]